MKRDSRCIASFFSARLSLILVSPHHCADRNINAESFTAVRRWIGKLQAGVNEQRARWDAAENQDSPELFFVPDASIIHDSRSGATIRRDVSRVGRLVRNLLDKPGRIGKIVKLFKNLLGLVQRMKLKQLEASGLIVQQDDRVLSVILEGECGCDRQMLRCEFMEEKKNSVSYV